MRYSLTRLALMLSLMTIEIASLHAEEKENAQIKPLNIRVFLGSEVPAKSNQVQDEVTRHKKDIQNQFKEFKRREDDLKNKAQELQKKQAVISSEAYNEERLKIEADANRLQSDFKFYEQKTQQEEQQMENKLRQGMITDIEEFRKDNNIDLLIDASMGVFAVPELDVTQNIVEYINKKYKAEQEKAKKTKGANGDVKTSPSAANGNGKK